MTSIVLTLAFPVGALVMRRRLATATGALRIVLAILIAAGAALAIPALRIVAWAVVDATADFSAAASLLTWKPLAVAFAAGTLLAAITLRRRPLATAPVALSRL